MNIYMMRGIPGSGKSTIARNLARALKGKTVILSKDGLREMMFPERDYNESDLLMVEIVRDTAFREIRICGYTNVIVDETFIENQDIKNFLTLTRRHDKVVVVDLTSVSTHTAVVQDDRRPRHLGPEIIERFAKTLEREDKDFRRLFPHLTVVDWKDTLKEDFLELQARADRYESLPVS